MIGIDFAHADRLWLLVGIVPLLAWSISGGRRRLREWSALGQSGRPIGDGASGWLASMALLVIALAQPRWGRSMGEEPPPGHDVVLCVDVSRSMAAEDALPNRLGVAVDSALSLLAKLEEEPGQRTSVVAFAGRAVIRCPMTSNLEAAADALRALRAGEIQPGGTDLGSALLVAARAFDLEERAEGRTLVVFSDGEDHGEAWLEAVPTLEAAGIVVHGVAIGDPDRAHPVPTLQRPEARTEPGPLAQSRRSDLALGTIARATGGALVPVGLARADLGALYRDRIEPMARRLRDEARPLERSQRYGAFVLGALAVGLVGSWPGRTRRRGRRVSMTVAALASLALATGAGPGGNSVEGRIQAGRTDFESGRFAEALEAFEQAIRLRSTAAIPRYNAASALFQLGRHKEAVSRYEEARTSAGPGLVVKIDFALGNAHLAMGDVPRALTFYDACLASDWPGADSDEVRRDAAENRAFAASRISPPPDEPTRNPGDSRRPDRPGKSRPGQPGSTGESPSNPPGSSGSNPAEPGNPNPSKAPVSNEGQARERPQGDTPETRLNTALREIRESRQVPPAEALPRSPAGSSKDW